MRTRGGLLVVVMLGAVLLSPAPTHGQATVAESSEGVPGPPGPTLTGADTDVCFVNGTDAVCNDSGFQWHTTTKRLAVEDDGRNLMIGGGAGFAPTTIGFGGLDNVLLGHLAGAAIVSGARNVCIGAGAMGSMTDADDNVVIGANASPLPAVQAGDVIIGSQAAEGYVHADITGDTANVIIGSFAGGATGSTDGRNVVIGRKAFSPVSNGGTNTTGGLNNVVIGYEAGFRAALLDGTIVIGSEACDKANAGLTNDIAIGRQAMEMAPGGGSDTDNIAIGYRALRNEDSSESGNVAIGSLALTAQTSGGNNTAVGDSTLKNATTAFDNTVVGYGAGAMLTGDDNTAVGWFAEHSSSAVADTTAIGSGAEAAATYAMALGANTQCTTTGTVCLGDSHVTGKVIIGETRSAVLCDLIGIPTCGTGCATVVANSGNCVGAVTTSTLATSVTVNWSGTRSQVPFCLADANSGAISVGITSVSTSSVTFGLSAGLTGTVFYHCLLGG